MISKLAIQQSHLVLSIFFLPEDLYFLRQHGVDGPADIVGLDGQLAAEAAVDENAELYLGGTAEIQQGVQGSPDGTARPEDIVYENDILVLDGEGDVGFVELVQTGPDVVAIEGDVQLSIPDGSGGDEGPELLNDAVGEIDATRLDTDEHGVFQLEMVFEQLIGQALYGDP